MAQRLLIFDIDSLVDLLTHYSEGAVDVGSEALAFEFNPILPRYISLVLQSKHWDSEDIDPATGELVPLQIRYEAKRVLKLENPKDQSLWSDEGAVEAPKRQF